MIRPCDPTGGDLHFVPNSFHSLNTPLPGRTFQGIGKKGDEPAARNKFFHFHRLLGELCGKAPKNFQLGNHRHAAPFQAVASRIREAKEFFEAGKDGLRVVFDGIGGTGGFVRGVPLFCVAVGILIDDEPRVAAIYDPIGRTIYSAVLSGPQGEPEIIPTG